jgi:hypothetical protein
MVTSLLELFQTLASFTPPKGSLADAPWEAYVDWAIAQGLGPLAAYNLEYRLGGAGAPEWARDRLLSVYQGSVNDNVLKLVNFKRAVDGLEGRKFLVLGGAAFAEALYPHVAFRPVIDLELQLRPADVAPLSHHLSDARFLPARSTELPPGASRDLFDGNTHLYLYTALLGPRSGAEEDALYDRALPVRVFGPCFFRPELEDAILITCLAHAREGYRVPMLSLLDLRELLRGAPDVSGPYTRAVDFPALLARAKAWRIERALYASTAIIARLFPEAREAAEQAQPSLRPATRRLLDRWVVEPMSQLGRVTSVRGSDRLRRLLAGGRT